MQKFLQNSDSEILETENLTDAQEDYELESPTRSKEIRSNRVKRKLFADAPKGARLEESLDLTLVPIADFSLDTDMRTEDSSKDVAFLASPPADPFTDSIISPRSKGRKSLPASISATEYTPKPKKCKKFVVPTISPPTSSSSPKRDSCVPDLRPRSSRKKLVLFQDRRVRS
jgi:hypothetical protein